MALPDLLARLSHTPLLRPVVDLICCIQLVQLDLPTPEEWKAELTIVDLIAPRPGVEPETFRSRVRGRTAAPPRQLRGGGEKKDRAGK